MTNGLPSRRSSPLNNRRRWRISQRRELSGILVGELEGYQRANQEVFD